MLNAYTHFGCPTTFGRLNLPIRARRTTLDSSRSVRRTEIVGGRQRGSARWPCRGGPISAVTGWNKGRIPQALDDARVAMWAQCRSWSIARAKVCLPARLVSRYSRFRECRIGRTGRCADARISQRRDVDPCRFARFGAHRRAVGRPRLCPPRREFTSIDVRGPSPHRQGSTNIFVCRFGLANSAKAPATPSMPTLPVTIGVTFTLPLAISSSD